MRIDWLDKLRLYLQTLAFCLAVSAIQFAFQPSKPYELPLVYSLCIGSATWALIDFGRHLFASSRETGWPQGAAGAALPLASIAGGYLLGTLAGDAWFGWSSWDAHPEARAQLPVSIIVTAIAGAAGTWYFYTRNKAAYLERKMLEASQAAAVAGEAAAQARQHAAESTLKLLEAQIEPHMLFNTLANLRALISTDPRRAEAMLDHLNNYLRATLGSSRASQHSLQDEFARIADYLEIMAIRMGPRLSFALDLPAGLQQAQVPALILQPLVENAIKHGLEPSVQGGRIRISAQRDGASLQLEVADSGVGLDAGGSRHGATTGQGFGLAQVRERLQTLFGGQARLALAPAANSPVTSGATNSGANDAYSTRAIVVFPYQNAA
jgi:signal transduction histidine kinase